MRVSNEGGMKGRDCVVDVFSLTCLYIHLPLHSSFLPPKSCYEARMPQVVLYTTSVVNTFFTRSQHLSPLENLFQERETRNFLEGTSSTNRTNDSLPDFYTFLLLTLSSTSPPYFIATDFSFFNIGIHPLTFLPLLIFLDVIRCLGDSRLTVTPVIMITGRENLQRNKQKVRFY